MYILENMSTEHARPYICHLMNAPTRNDHKQRESRESTRATTLRCALITNGVHDARLRSAECAPVAFALLGSPRPLPAPLATFFRFPPKRPAFEDVLSHVPGGGRGTVEGACTQTQPPLPFIKFTRTSKMAKQIYIQARVQHCRESYSCFTPVTVLR